MKLESIYLIVATVDSSLLLGLYTATYIRLKRGSQYKKVMNIVVLLIASNVGTLLNRVYDQGEPLAQGLQNKPAKENLQ